MAKKSSSKTRAKEFSDRPRIKREEVAPVDETPIQEPEVNNVEQEESFDEPVDESIEETPEQGEKITTTVDYKVLNVPLGSKKENGVILAVVLSTLLIVTLLGFLTYYEYSWRLHEEEQENALVESDYEGLRKVVKNYVATIEEDDKAELLKELRDVYIAASKSTEDIDSILDTIRTQSQEILGFNDRRPRTKEYEWYKLFGVHGVIDTWMTEAGEDFTKKNQKKVFTAIAEGLK